MQNQLIFNNFSIDDSNIHGGVFYNLNVNPTVNINPGTVACARVEFVTDYFNSTSTALNKQFTYKVKMIDQDSFKQIGKFTILDSQKMASGLIKCVAYDNCYKLDNLLADGVVSSVRTQSGATIRTLFNALCTAAGCTPELPTPLINSDMPISDTLSVSNLSARAMIGYIAQAVGGFAFCNRDGNLTIGNFNTNGSNPESATRSTYKKLDYSEVAAPRITSVKIARSEDDLGTVVGDQTGRQLGVYYNPLFYPTDNINLRATNLLNTLKFINYYPTTIEAFNNYNIWPDNALKFYDRDETERTTLVFNISWNIAGVTLSSTADNNEALFGTTEDAAIRGLQGKYNVLQNDLDGFKRTVGNTYVTKDGLATEVETQVGQSTERIWAEVNKKVSNDELEAEVSAQVEISTQGLNTRVTQAINTANGAATTATEAKQTAEGFSQRIEDAEGNITTIETTIQGVAYTSSLAAGTTTINGGCITTGTISANRINGNGLNVSNATIGNCTITNGSINIKNGNTTVIQSGTGSSGLGISVHDLTASGEVRADIDGFYGVDFTNTSGDKAFGYPGAPNNTGLKNVIQYLLENGGGGGGSAVFG